MEILLPLLAACLGAEAVRTYDEYPGLPPLSLAAEFGRTHQDAWVGVAAARDYLDWLEFQRAYRPHYSEAAWEQVLQGQRQVVEAWRLLVEATQERYIESEYGAWDNLETMRRALAELEKTIGPLAWGNRLMPDAFPEGWR